MNENVPTLSIDDPTVTEGDNGTVTLTFTVSLSSPALAGGVTFDIATANDTATVANNDYVAQILTAQTITEGALLYTFDVTINGDTSTEPNETVLVNVTNVTGATVADGQGSGTITNDDTTPLVINEIDADQTGTDADEFIELYGTAGASLNGYMLVLYNGSNNQSYAAFDLDGLSLDANGYFVLGNSGVANVDLDRHRRLPAERRRRRRALSRRRDRVPERHGRHGGEPGRRRRLREQQSGRSRADRCPHPGPGAGQRERARRWARRSRCSA